MIKLQQVLDLHARGLGVIPVDWKSKKSKVKWKPFQEERPSESLLRKWFGDDDQQSCAVLMGKPSGGVVVRDFDDPAGYLRWSTVYPDLAATLPTVATARGYHVYAKCQGQNQIQVFADGELRGGGYAIAPPSRHESGFTYRWFNQLPDIGAEIPELDVIACGLAPRCNTESARHMKFDGAVCAESTVCSESAVLAAPPVCSATAALPVLQDRVELAIRSTLPTAAGQRHRALFEFARRLRAIAELANAPLRQLKPYVVRWHAAALPNISTKPFDDTWFEFQEAWEHVKWPAGQGPIDELFAKALRAERPDAARQYETPALQLLVAFCRELQRASGDSPFFLGCRTAGGLLAVHHVPVSRWLRGLVKDGVLELVSKGTLSAHRASEYRYLGD